MLKFFIFFFYLAHQLTESSARWWITTPMPSAMRTRTKNDATSQVVDMIDFINSVYKNDDRNIARTGRRGGFHSKRQVSRRFELPALQVKSLPASLGPTEDKKESPLKKMPDTVRFHVIDNPEVLEAYSKKQKKKKNVERHLLRKKTSSANIDSSLDDKLFDTNDDKIKYYHVNDKLKAGSHNRTNMLNTSDTFVKSHHETNPNFEPVDSAQELTNKTTEPTYLPEFANDDSDNDIKVQVTEKDYNEPKSDEKYRAESAKIYNDNEFDKRITGTRHKVNVGKNNAYNIGPKKHESHMNNDQVRNKRRNKKFDYHRNVKMRADSNNDYSHKYEGKKKKGHLKEDNNIEKDMQPQQTKGNKRKHTSPAQNISKKHTNKSKERHSIDADKDRSKNNQRHHKKGYKKVDNHEIEVKKRNHKESIKKGIHLNKHESNEYDKMEYEWNKRHLQYDKNDNLNDSDNDEETLKDYDLIKRQGNLMKHDTKINDKVRNFYKKNSRIYTTDEEINEDYWDRKLHEQENSGYDAEDEKNEVYKT